MKKFKFAITFVLLSFVALSGILFGCGNKYQNMKIETSESELVFYYGGTEEDQVEMNKSFTATVSGAPSGVSTSLVYSMTNDIVTVRKTNNGNETLFELTAKEYPWIVIVPDTTTPSLIARFTIAGPSPL